MQLKTLTRHLPTLLVAGATLLLSGCATHYLDKGTPEVPASQFAKPASLKPAQFVFEFQTNGAPNANATKYLKEQVDKQIRDSGLFSTVTDTPASNGALLNLTLNNIANMDEATKSGFLTGLTFGAKGSFITDGYLCTVKYLGPNSNTPIIKTSKHAIYTSMGSDSGTDQGIKIENLDDGVRTMVRQVISQALNALSQDPGFKSQP